MIPQTEVKKSLYTSLKELGLTESEANLYITSLSLGPATIASLAEHLNMPRPNVYKVIAGLERHGLAKFSERKRYTRTFVVEPPTVVLEKLRKKREAVANLDQTLVGMMPDLLAQYHQGETPTKIRIFRGKEQYLKTFFDVIDEAKGESQVLGSAADFIGFISWDEEREWIKRRMEKGIHIKALLLPSKDTDMLRVKDAEEMRETRVLKTAQPFVTLFQLYANKALIWQPKAPLAILIEDEYIVQMLRSVFDVLWKQSGE
ncbi:MAG: Transcriptional regulator, TrmB [Candidatus Uhrbacteria bacterium GW2011_GWA2_53_10]|uniref:Transcriptional regulator, TrmB n=1 Tax=Candidatus Uhrbacteria bacterium GW2011_GWA2_53_10 TaxID=1618980 RepID=A0A0G1XPD1_9BACT|nr:MAG: Transcriptional regulator, TrmB [Candidatus Uhrbacteria bacterium GW2011_GWA2_53_10]